MRSNDLMVSLLLYWGTVDLNIELIFLINVYVLKEYEFYPGPVEKLANSAHLNCAIPQGFIRSSRIWTTKLIINELQMF